MDCFSDLSLLLFLLVFFSAGDPEALLMVEFMADTKEEVFVKFNEA